MLFVIKHYKQKCSVALLQIKLRMKFQTTYKSNQLFLLFPFAQISRLSSMQISLLEKMHPVLDIRISGITLSRTYPEPTTPAIWVQPITWVTAKLCDRVSCTAHWWGWCANAAQSYLATISTQEERFRGSMCRYACAKRDVTVEYPQWMTQGFAVGGTRECV